MNKTRKGKIARLPAIIRQELNIRLCDGETGAKLAAWLNAQPEVQAMLAEDFGTRPIREQNLSEWRKGGLQDWLVVQRSFEAAGRIAESIPALKAAGKGSLTDHIALWVTARYAVVASELDWQGPVKDEAAWERLREFSRDVSNLRQDEQRARALWLKRKWWELLSGRANFAKADEKTIRSNPVKSDL